MKQWKSFKCGKFELRKWQSNESSLDDPDLQDKTKLLGLNWDFYPNLVQAVWFCLEKDALTFTLTKKPNRGEARCFAHS